jgi:dienelactone hydrolase
MEIGGEVISSYQVDEQGILRIVTPPPYYTETILESSGNVTQSHIIFQNQGAEVHALLTTPLEPVAAVVYVPGAGVKKQAHQDRALCYAQEGIAFLIMDIRGNGDETSGYSPNLQKDYSLFSAGKWPQYYLIINDIITAQKMLQHRFDVPVHAMGSSNGGRYAAVAAGIDDEFAGYIGVSTSGFGGEGARFTGDIRRFLLSIDPDMYIARISPMPVLIFHAPGDEIIPFTHGLELFNNAREPKEFRSFNGTHGMNGEVDEQVITTVLTFNAR